MNQVRTGGCTVGTFHQDLLFGNRLEQFVVLRVVLADGLWRNRVHQREAQLGKQFHLVNLVVAKGLGRTTLRLFATLMNKHFSAGCDFLLISVIVCLSDM